MTVLDVWTSWIAWPLWVGFALLVITAVVEHVDRRRNNCNRRNRKETP